MFFFVLLHPQSINYGIVYSSLFTYGGRHGHALPDDKLAGSGQFGMKMDKLAEIWDLARLLPLLG